MKLRQGAHHSATLKIKQAAVSDPRVAVVSVVHM